MKVCLSTLAIASVSILLLGCFLGCDSAFIVRKYNDSGKLIEEQAWLKSEGSEEYQQEAIPHGLHVIWDTTGQRKQLMVYNRGKRVGYVLTWDSEGRLYRDGQPVEPGLAHANHLDLASNSSIPH